ncbi:MAG: nucleotidyltransferase domain-containing protein, partial [Betaproteobacteria bacterium]
MGYLVGYPQLYVRGKLAGNGSSNEPPQPTPQPTPTREQALLGSQTKKPFLQREGSVVSIALFGLAARNQMTEISEVDLLVEFAHPITYQRY